MPNVNAAQRQVRRWRCVRQEAWGRSVWHRCSGGEVSSRPWCGAAGRRCAGGRQACALPSSVAVGPQCGNGRW